MKGLWLALVPSVLAAQAARNDSASAPIHDVRYDVTFTRANAPYRVVDVAMTFTTAGNVERRALATRVDARRVRDQQLCALGRRRSMLSGDGKPLAWDKLDFDTWRIRPAGAKSVSRVVSTIAPTRSTTRCRGRGPTSCCSTGRTSSCIPKDSRFDFPATVTIHTERDWRIATGMTPREPTPRARIRRATTTISWTCRSSSAGSTWTARGRRPAGCDSRAIPPERSPARPRTSAWDQLKRVIPPETAVFGETPWRRYTVMQIADSTYGGASGLEHQNSHVDILAPAYVGSEFQPSLYAHEIFHAWNVKRLRPADMWPYRYVRPQPTPWLWVSEGITDYYADLAERARRRRRRERVLRADRRKDGRGRRRARPSSLEDASLNAWIHPVDGTEYIYYPEGFARGPSARHHDPRRERQRAFARRRDARPLPDRTTSRAAASRRLTGGPRSARAAGGKSFAAFSAKYIDGRAPFPIDSVLPLAGLRTHAAMVPRLGVMTQLDSNGVMVAQVQEGSAASAAGVRAGRLLVDGRRRRRAGRAVRGPPASQIRRVGRGLPAPDQGAARIGDAHASGKAALRTWRSDGGSRSQRQRKGGANSERDPEGDHRLNVGCRALVALSHGGNSAADAAHGPDVCDTDRISFHTVLSASSSSIGSDSPATRVVSSE